MGDGVKGTVTPLASIFPAQEALKAAKRVEESIAEREKEVESLQGFISDNTAIVNLVRRLPEELSHDIMVPFGKAAFFPGRLIHTNEFLEKDESLKDYIGRFNREALQVSNLDPSAAMNALLSDVRSAEFRHSIAKKAPSTLADLIAWVEKYIIAEETLAALNLNQDNQTDSKRKD
ncbi:uncharacterized protein LOC143891041 [Tasmannia lanceolata]|uniref:uncharacterized protein LOC143891041 n=1 Tax=Tasmannia lanceolata TaxID=3420 RepID=UPI004062D4F5